MLRVMALIFIIFATSSVSAEMFSSAKINNPEGNIIIELYDDAPIIPECSGSSAQGAIAKIETKNGLVGYGTGCWTAGTDGYIYLKIKSIEDGVVRESSIHNSKFISSNKTEGRSDLSEEKSESSQEELNEAFAGVGVEDVIATFTYPAIVGISDVIVELYAGKPNDNLCKDRRGLMKAKYYFFFHYQNEKREIANGCWIKRDGKIYLFGTKSGTDQEFNEEREVSLFSGKNPAWEKYINNKSAAKDSPQVKRDIFLTELYGSSQDVKGWWSEKNLISVLDNCKHQDRIPEEYKNSSIYQYASMRLGEDIFIYKNIDNKASWVDIYSKSDSSCRNILAELQNAKSVGLNVEHRVRFGIEVGDVETGNSEKIVQVKNVLEESAARSAGIKTGDIIIAVQGKQVYSANEALVAMRELPISTKKATLSIIREGIKHEIDVTFESVSE